MLADEITQPCNLLRQNEGRVPSFPLFHFLFFTFYSLNEIKQVFSYVFLIPMYVFFVYCYISVGCAPSFLYGGP